MSEVFNRRSTASASGSGSGDDPLAELARIVGAEDPFANLFDDARAPEGTGRQQPHRASGVHLQERVEPEIRLPRAIGLRGGYDEPEHQVSSASNDEPDAAYFAAREAGTGPAASSHDGLDQAYYDDYAPGEDAYTPHSVETRSRPYVGGMMALGLLAFAVLGGGVGYAWTSGLFDATGLPGTGSAPPVILASDKPTKVKPAAAPGQDEVASAKEIFDRLGQVGTDTPETVVPREELPVAIDNPVEPAAPAAESAAAGSDPEVDVPEGRAAPKGVQVASAEPLPPGSLSPEPRRVRTVKVLADGTVVTGQAAASPLATSRGVEGGEGQESGSTLAAGVDVGAGEADQGDGSGSAATADLDNLGRQGADQEGADQEMVGSFADAVPGEAAQAQEEAASVALPPARPRTIASEPRAPAASAQPARVQVAALEPSATAKPAAPAGAYVVQISSQKSEADALSSFKGMQRKFPGVLAGVRPSVKRAELGGKGTFYRLRVGAWSSREEATAFCARLKTAGGDCVVARN
jgi:SPOR domain